ncbi:MAG TPA: translation initiation factor IF-2 [Terriglobia bacterium]|nr:translation initiation factor IF-2 [Terriglobia bacterium]
MSGKIRINDLARELEIKNRVLLDYLHEIGHADIKSHSSAIEGDIADKVREHFRESEQPSAEPQKPSAASQALPAQTASPAASAPSTPPPVTPKAPTPVAHPHEATPLVGRTIDQIKEDVRRAITPPPVRPASPSRIAPLAPGERVIRPAAGAPSEAAPARTAPSKAVPLPGVSARLPALDRIVTPPSAAPRPAAQPVSPSSSVSSIPARTGIAGSQSKPSPIAARQQGRPAPGKKPLASDQPIYPGAARPKASPARPLATRRPGEHRPMHPTTARTAPKSPADGGAQATRPAPYRGAPGGRPLPGRPLPQLAKPIVPEEVPITRNITITEGVSIKELSEKLEVRAKDVIKRLLEKGIFSTINQTLDSQTAQEVSRGFGATVTIISYEEEVTHEVEVADKPEDLRPRPPVVTVMGHVDHGKTSLLDAIRETSVAAREAGGITQHIGAYHVDVGGRKVVFLDTPGHEAFTLMRARGARVTDLVILVVAADDGVMPQTVEAINHARAAEVPILVAINKIDKPEANPERVKKQLADLDLMPEAWGGNTVTVEVSAKQKKNLELLLEMVLLVADMQAIKANPNRLASGTVLEAKLDRGRGPVATVLVQNGTLHAGDAFIVGSIYGKVRAMLNDLGQPSVEAPPSTPVEVLGLEDVPQAGDKLHVIEDTGKARQIALHRQAKAREMALAKSARLTLDQLHQQLAAGDVKELPLILKADVQGSVEVLTDTLSKLSDEKVKVKVIDAGVGAITETNVLLATASNAVIIGFNVRPERKAAELAALERVDIRLHTIIYELVDEIRKAKVGLLAVKYKETALGRIEVRDVFRISKVGTVAGGYVQDGKLTREAKVRLLRDNVVVYEGQIRSLRRFKDDVPEVRSGMECGIALENFNDVKTGDVIEAYVTERVVEEAIA